MDDLIKRLRVRAPLIADCGTAADLIEEQAARISDLETKCRLYEAALDKADKEADGLRAARIAYASEFAPDAEGLPDVGNIHANIRALKAQITAADGWRKDADAAYETLAAIGDYAHARSTGPAVPDALWEVRRMAYEAVYPAIDAALAQQEPQ